MISRVHSSILQGIDAIGGEVEADAVTTADKPDIKLDGLADKAVQESVSRIRPCATAGIAGPGRR